MKLTNLKKLTENYGKISDEYFSLMESSKANPEDVALKRKYALAAAKHTRAKKTLSNYSPALYVTLGQFADCTKEVFDAMGIDSTLTCFDFHTNATGKTQANLFLDLAKGDQKASYNLFKVVLDDENQALADVRINLLTKGMIKGWQPQRLEAIGDKLDIISWNAITKTILNSIEEKKIAKAIKEEERLQK